MSRHNNISILVVAITVLYVLVSFTIYFNNHGLDKAWSIQQKDKGMVVLGVHSPEHRQMVIIDTVVIDKYYG